MIIFAKYNELECGINDDGDLFLGDDRSGYNLPDTLENRERILNDFAILAMDKSRGGYSANTRSKAQSRKEVSGGEHKALANPLELSHRSRYPRKTFRRGKYERIC